MLPLIVPGLVSLVATYLLVRERWVNPDPWTPSKSYGSSEEAERDLFGTTEAEDAAWVDSLTEVPGETEVLIPNVSTIEEEGSGSSLRA